MEEYKEQFSQLEEVDHPEYGTETKESELPIAYRDSTNTDEDVMCIIGPNFDKNGVPIKGEYVAQFQNLTTKEQKTAQLEDLKHIDRFRNELALEGWRMVRNPQMSWNNGQTESAKHRRWIARQDAKAQRREAKMKKAVAERKRRMREEAEKRREFAESLKKNLEK